MQQLAPLTRDLVLIGGGHTHALVLRRWGMNPLPGARLTLINPGPTAPYTGMLPGFVAGHYRREDLDIDLVRLARFAGARLILDSATGLDLGTRAIHLAGRAPIGYDIASIDIGITSQMVDIDGFSEFAIAAKPLDRFAAAWTQFLDAPAAPVAVLGGGVAGIELALTMDYALKATGQPQRVTLIEKETALSGIGSDARQCLRKHLGTKGIRLIEQAEVRAITADGVELSDEVLPSAFTVGAAGARPYGWLSEIGVETRDGYLSVGPTLQTSDPRIFAAGDCAHLAHAPRPKAGVFAVRAAPTLARNLRAALSGRAFGRFHPQSDYLKLITLGETSALGEKFGRAFEGPAIWRWKDRIDRRFMLKLNTLPDMAHVEVPPIAARDVQAMMRGDPLCGGCGAKVGAANLDAALAQLGLPGGAQAPGDDAAVLTVGTERMLVTTDHLRAFWTDPAVFARIATFHAMGDIWAMGAMPDAAFPTIILPPLSDSLQRRWLDEIMGAINIALGETGATLAGGHTTVGSELSIGLTITGRPGAEPIGLGGAKPGDALILTRPLGSGTLLAGEMRGKAKGADVADLLSELARPQGAAASALGTAHAMTDVTGFGLAGHLLRILRASGVAATLTLDAVPVFAGAEALSAAGVRSTIYASNREDTRDMTLPGGAGADLLFDPQTAGGLLAAVARISASTILKSLIKSRFDAAIIGEITEGAPHITVRKGAGPD